MKTLEQIKDEVANELHQCTFKQTYLLISILKKDEMLNEVVKRYAQQACEDLRERIAEEAKVNWQDSGFNTDESRSNFWIDGAVVSVCKDSILNTEIILP